MANEEHLSILRQGVDAWNQWRKQKPEIRPNLSGADLRSTALIMVNLSRGDFSNTMEIQGPDLRGANLRRADLSQVKLNRIIVSNADLREANLSGADLGDADLSGSDLRGATFREADLGRATLRWVTLSGADFTSALIGWTIFGSVDLSEVKGLDTVKHSGPSTIGIDTITQSQGKIPEVFLRGAGVPDVFITYMQSLTGAALEYYSCFISYSTKDQAFAERLHADLQAKGVRCWFAPEDIQGGKKIHEQIDHAIRLHDKLLIVLSEHSMNSEWVKTEVYNARQQELKEQRRKLFPISLVEYNVVREWQAFDADTGKDMGREVREYFIPDFTHWKDHDAYQNMFDRLLRSLKTEG